MGRNISLDSFFKLLLGSFIVVLVIVGCGRVAEEQGPSSQAVDVVTGESTVQTEISDEIPISGSWYATGVTDDGIQYDITFTFSASGEPQITIISDSLLGEVLLGTYAWFPDAGLLTYSVEGYPSGVVAVDFEDYSHAVFTDIYGNSISFDRVEEKERAVNIASVGEATYEKAQHRLPPVIASIDFPDPVTAGETSEFSWSVVGYHDEYIVQLCVYDEDDDRIFSEEVSAYQTEDGNYSWGAIQSREFFYRTNVNLAFSGNQELTVRFFVSPPNDPIDTTFLSCVIPSGLGYEPADSAGRKITISGIGERVDAQSSEPTYEKAQHRLPPVIYSLDIPQTVNRSETYDFEWSVLGYHDDYKVKIVIEDQAGERILNREVGYYKVQDGSYRWGDVQSREFFYRTEEQLVFEDDQELTVRFFISPPTDSIDTTFLSCVVPGGLGYNATSDSLGRKFTIQALDDRAGGITLLEDVADIPHIHTMFTVADVLVFNDEKADEFRSLVEEHRYVVVIALFFALQYDGYLSSFIVSDDFEEFLTSVAEDESPEYILGEIGGIYGEAAALAANLLVYAYPANNVVNHILNSEGDIYFVFSNYPPYELPVEHCYSNGVFFVADDLSERSLDEVNWLTDCLYFSSLDEAVVNPNGYTLGKANRVGWDEYEAVPNNWEKTGFLGLGKYQAP